MSRKTKAAARSTANENQTVTATTLEIVAKLYRAEDYEGIDAIFHSVCFASHASHVPLDATLAIFKALVERLPANGLEKMAAQAAKESQTLADMQREWALADALVEIGAERATRVIAEAQAKIAAGAQ